MSTPTLEDLVQPLVVGTEQTVWIKEPAYVTGGRVVVTNDGEQGAVSLGVLESPSGTLASLSLKDTNAFAVRNQKYAGGALQYEQLPILVTEAGRVVLNAPGLLQDTDGRIADSQLTVFGGIRADRIAAQTLDVQDITSLNFKFVKGAAAVANEIVLTLEDNTTTNLPIGWDTIKNKPTTFPVDAQLTESIPYLTNRIQLAQFNVDYLLREVTRLQGEIDSVDRLTVNDNTTFGPPLDGVAMAAGFQGDLAAGVTAVRVPLL
jgi:hypothetical protein